MVESPIESCQAPLRPRKRASSPASLREYFAIGVKLVWVVDPEARIVYAYRSLTDVRELDAAATLVGDDVLPGFEVAVAALFEE